MSASPVSERVLRSEYLRRALGVSMFVPAGPARAHLKRLRGAPYHMSFVRIADLSGLSQSNLSQVAAGRRGAGRNYEVVDEVHRDTEAAVLGVKPEVAVPGRGGGQVSPVGARRRLQALAAAGYPLRHLSELMEWGHDPQPVHRFIVGKSGSVYVQHSTHLKACRVYDELAGADPLELGFTPLAVKRAQAAAQRRGYAPPRCWDPDTIDDPEAIPEWTGRCGTFFGWMIHESEGIPACGPCSAAREGGSFAVSPERLREARIAAGLQVPEVARRAHVSRDTLRGWENGRTQPQTLQALLRVLTVLDATFEDVAEPRS